MERQILKSIAGIGEGALGCGLLLGLAINRFLISTGYSGLSARMGFNMGWLFVFGAVLCIAGIWFYLRRVRGLAEAQSVSIDETGLFRGLAVMVAVGAVVGIMLAFFVSQAIPALIPAYSAIGLKGPFPVVITILLPIIIGALMLRNWLPKWAAGFIVRG